LAYLYNSLVIIYLLVFRSFKIKIKSSISIDLFINSLEILIRYSIWEGLLIERPELVKALLEALVKINIVSSYIVFWEINLLYFFFIIFSLIILLLVYI
jgi:hypothetical protein